MNNGNPVKFFVKTETYSAALPMVRNLVHVLSGASFSCVNKPISTIVLQYSSTCSNYSCTSTVAEISLFSMLRTSTRVYTL